MFAMLSEIRNGDDAFNREGVRNLRNTSRYAYNCGGYALGTFSWYCPNSEENGLWGCWRFWSQERMEAITNECVRHMLADFPEMRVIKNVSELTASEYAIAFRVSSNGDFHYVKRNSVGHWFHKLGSCPDIETMTVKEVFNEDWCGMYNGPIVLFAKQK